MNSAPESPVTQGSADFSTNLIEAMRRVVEVSRDRTLADLRSSLEADSGQVDLASADREKGLRERAGAEVAEIGAWERSEVERVKAEAVRRVQARKAQLEKELADLGASADAQRAALTARADDYERQVAEFIAELEQISDPAAFAAAARRMPMPGPSAAPEPPSAAKPQPAVAEPKPSGAAPEQAIAEPKPSGAAPEPGVDEPKPTTAALKAGTASAPTEAPGDQAAAAAGDAGSAQATTSIMVDGLSSFGAITSFKQALERQLGIGSVILSLGSSGEFVFTVWHAPAFDVSPAILAVESAAQIARDGDTLRVRIGVPTG